MDHQPGAQRLIDRALRFASATSVLAIMLLTTADVVARYLIAAPIPGAYECVQVLLALAVFLGLPLVTLRNSHITVGAFAIFSRGSFGRWLQLTFMAITAIVLAVVAHRLWLLADLVARGSQTIGALEIPLSPLYRALSILAAMTVLLMLAYTLPDRLRRPCTSR